MKYLKLTAILAAFLLTAINHLNAQTVQVQPVLSGLTAPVLATNARDDSNRLFVVQQNGVIKVLQPNAAATDYLNILSKIAYGGERGLLGLAFHPQFTANGRFFVNYTRAGDGATVIAEYKAANSAANTVDAATERILLVIAQPYPNHNGGMIAFGPDGYLYIGMGDGGNGNDPQNRAQNKGALLGKFLRIDVNVAAGSTLPYAIPADNPFVGANTQRCDDGSGTATTAGNTCQEIYTIGMRNPFRWSFDRRTGQLLAGDVGQDAIEEIDVIQKGKNYGWRVYEGNQCTNNDPNLCAPTNYEPPIYQYTHQNGRCSIIGGYVYRGVRNTVAAGTYLFSDYCTGEIIAWQNGQANTLLTTAFGVSAFGEDEAGELYVCNVSKGTVGKIVNPNAAAARRVVSDFDGDLRTDISVFRPASGTWFVSRSSDNGFAAAQFGQSGDKLAPGDYDGDGKTDFAVFRENTGDVDRAQFYVYLSATNTVQARQFGRTGDVPVIGDYDGDRKSDFAVFRPSNGYWYILNSATNTIRYQQFGTNADQAVPGDYDGDGQTDVAVRRPSSNVWYILRSRTNSIGYATFGLSGDVPVIGDYDGDGNADVAVWRPSNGTWYALQSSNNQLIAAQWGTSGDTPAPGDYDGDGRTDFAVTRNQSNGKIWYVLRSLDGAIRNPQFGLNSDIAVPPTDNP